LVGSSPPPFFDELPLYTEGNSSKNNVFRLVGQTGAMKHAMFLAPFGDLADPRRVAEVARAAEEAGWDGLFLWDHVMRPPEETSDVADAWIAMAAAASVTERIRLGPMVTPIVRRRPIKLAREAISLDLLSDGRLTLGLGLGVDSGRELSAFGEETDPRTRGDMLDEGADLLRQMLGGERVDHRGTHYLADGVTIRPEPVQRPLPIWMAARGGARRPVRRAARFDGLFPIEVDVDQFSAMLDIVAAERGDLDGFEVSVVSHPGVDLAAFEARGATWAMHSWLPNEPFDDVMAGAQAGPAG
jgi:alkanesulfonate monooxygenase SsuD/methylene tetrahydromethanopterin reductase-like flavin-dependent oxidoreductase (luciferase family)